MISVHDVATMTWGKFKELFEVKYITKAARVAKKKRVHKSEARRHVSGQIYQEI